MALFPTDLTAEALARQTIEAREKLTKKLIDEISSSLYTAVRDGYSTIEFTLPNTVPTRDQLLDLIVPELEEKGFQISILNTDAFTISWE